jgi:hypothetical protein
MPTMSVQVRLRVDPMETSGEQEEITADLMAMLEYLALPPQVGTAGWWPGNQLDIEVDYDAVSGLHSRTDLVSGVREWFAAYAAHLAQVRDDAPAPVIDEAPASQETYYYTDGDRPWCQWFFATYLRSADSGNEWSLQMGSTRARVRIGVRYPMLDPVPQVASLVAEAVA